MTDVPGAAWVCPTCGAHYPPAAQPPELCQICADERQWVPPGGQVWTTLEELAASGYRSDIREVEPGLLGLGVNRHIGVGHRGLLVRTAQGNVLWDPPAFIDDAALAAVREAGGLRAVSASHPHMYGALALWTSAFDVPAWLPEADAEWLTRPEAPVHRWSGTAAVLDGVTLVQCGGHFAGSAALHWSGGAQGRGALLVGDTMFVTPGEDRISFAWSYPNRLPLPERLVRGIAEALAPWRFERVYDGWWEPVLRRAGDEVLARSAERYIAFLRGDAPTG